MTDTFAEIVKFNITNAEIAKASKECMKLVVTAVDDMINYDIVKQARINIKLKRVEVEKTRKSKKAKALQFGRDVDTEAKRIFQLLAPIEDYLISQEKIVDDEKQRIKDEKERIERERIEAEEEEERKAEEEKQERIREEQRIEDERLKQIRLQQEEKEKELKQEQDKLDDEKKKIDDEKEKAAQEKQNQIDIKNAEDNARREAEENAEREKEDKRLQEEQKVKDEKLRIAQLPDKERIILYAEALKAVPLPAIINTQLQEKFKIGKGIVIEAYKYFKSI